MPGRVAVRVDCEGDLTEQAWEARSTAVARGLAARGVGTGDRVALRFDCRRWIDFAVAALGVRKAGAVAVLLSPGAASPDLARALRHSEAIGLVGASPQPVPCWVADVDVLERGDGTEPTPAGASPDIGYPPAPLAPPRPWTLPEDVEPPEWDGWLVHAWSPGSRAGQLVLRGLRGGRGSAATLATFDPERLCALVEQRRATACGLTPALAAALVGSGVASRHDLTSVIQVLLTAVPSAPVHAGLEAVFAAARVTVLDATPAPVATGVPVGVAQEAMLWHEQFVPGSFNLPCLVRRYRGPLDVAALEWSFHELARRHEPLRTTFTLAGGAPEQVVRDALAVRHEDLVGRGPEVRDVHMAGLLAEATTRAFDLVAGPLFEPHIVRLGIDDHAVVVRLHHTVFDDWSVDVFRRELSALYTARVAGVPSPLAEPVTSFSDFSSRGDRGAGQRAWWRRELAGAPLAVQMPIGGDGADPEPGVPVRVDLPPSLAAGVRTLAPTLRATPYMTLLAAFAALVSRKTGQDDLLIATVVAHRNETDLEPLIGCFTKKVPLRLRLDGDPTFADLVARARASLLGALAHQDLAFDAAVQEGLGEDAAAHWVVPQVAVVFQAEAPQQAKLTLPGVDVGPYAVPPAARRERHFSEGAAAWGDGMYLGTFLVLSLLQTADGMALIARGVFDRPSCRRLLDELVTLLGEVVAHPEEPLPSPKPAPSADVVDMRGLRASRSRIEAALATCPGVEWVTVAVQDGRLVAYVVGDGGPVPTPARLRRALWAVLPGVMCPAEFVGVESNVPPDPDSDILPTMWAEIAARPDAPRQSYWQDFSFLRVLAEAREAGLAVRDDDVVRCRTPEMLAAARAARP